MVLIWLVYVINFSESYEMCARGKKIIDFALARITKIKMVSSFKIIHLGLSVVATTEAYPSLRLLDKKLYNLH